MKVNAQAFTAANSFPIKILRNQKLMESLLSGKVIPWHVQLNLTNQCNYHCNFCSCEERDRSLQLSMDTLNEMVPMFKSLGMACVTITGGGEPLTYKNISELLELLVKNDIEVGLVTNGSLLHRLSKSDLDKITWCRISCSDDLHNQIDLSQWFRNVNCAISKGSNVDWAFSYVLSKQPDYVLIESVVQFANKNNFTHVRIVSDLLDIKNVPSMNLIKKALELNSVDTSKVIFQGRKNYVKGFKHCYISLLKPVIGADGNLYPCCGTQYALDKPSRDYEKLMCMGSWRDLPKLIEEQKFFYGDICQRCYYSDYQFLERVIAPIEHVRFV